LVVRQPAEPRVVPFIVSGPALLLEAGFTEGRQWIKVELETGGTFKFFLTRETDLEFAVKERRFFIRGVVSSRNRLIGIDSDPPEPLTPDERKAWALDRWSEVL